MVQNIPASALHGYQNNIGVNKSNNYVAFKGVTQGLEQDTFTPQFTGRKQEKKGVFGKLLLLAAAVGGAVLLKRNWKQVTKYVDDIIKKFGKNTKQTTTNTTEKLSKQAKRAKARANKVQAEKTYKRPQKVSVTTAYNKAQQEVVTDEMIRQHRKSLRGERLTKKQRKALAQLEQTNATQRAEINSIANNSAEITKSKQGLQLENLRVAAHNNVQAGKVIPDGPIRHTNNNIYHYKDGKIVKIERFQQKKTGELVANGVVTDPRKIAEHLGKHHIDNTVIWGGQRVQGNPLPVPENIMQFIPKA